MTFVDHERCEERPALLARSQGAVDEQVGDHCTGRWLPTDGGCSSSCCRGVHASTSSAGHTSCAHAELPGEYLYSRVRRWCAALPCRRAVGQRLGEHHDVAGLHRHLDRHLCGDA